MKGLLLGLLITIAISTSAFAQDTCVSVEDLGEIQVRLRQGSLFMEMYEVCEETQANVIAINSNLQIQIDELIKQRDSAQSIADVYKANIEKERADCDILIEAAKPTWGDRALWVLTGIVVALFI